MKQPLHISIFSPINQFSLLTNLPSTLNYKNNKKQKTDLGLQALLQLLDKLSRHDADTLRSHDIEVQPHLHVYKILEPTWVLLKPKQEVPRQIKIIPEQVKTATFKSPQKIQTYTFS